MAIDQIAVTGGRVNCPSCAVTVRDAVEALPGVDSAEVNFAVERVTVAYDPDQVDIPTIQSAIAEPGCRGGGFAEPRQPDFLLLL